MNQAAAIAVVGLLCLVGTESAWANVNWLWGLFVFVVVVMGGIHESRRP